jgi:predicted GIY-YIG superfamily endonuclease
MFVERASGGHHMRYYYIYIMTNKPNGTLYVGMTGNLLQRVAQTAMARLRASRRNTD